MQGTSHLSSHVNVSLSEISKWTAPGRQLGQKVGFTTIRQVNNLVDSQTSCRQPDQQSLSIIS